MQIPVRLVFLLHPSVPVGTLLAIGFSVVVFTSTPFLLPEIASDYDVSLGVASLISVAQLSGFVVSTWLAGRFVQPAPRVFLIALVLASAANIASAPLPLFGLLVALRLTSGLSLGVIAWYGWVQAFGDDRRMGDVAVTGPMVGVIAAPLVAIVAGIGGPELLFAALGAGALIPLAFPYGTGGLRLPERRARNRAVPAARIILLSLGLFTLGGASVFQYAVVLGTDAPGLSTSAIAIGFSLNALVGIPAARTTRRGIPSPWMATTAACAIVLSTTGLGWLFVIALIMWGFSFWMATPAVFKVLASRSQFPEERAGDAQAMMAAGRAFGPFLGGVLIDGPGTTALGLIGAGLMLAAAAGVFAVRSMAPPRVSI